MGGEVISITSALDFFAQALDRGRAVLLGDVNSLFRLLLTIEVILAGVYSAVGGSGDLRAVARKILVVGLFAWFINSYDYVLQVLIDGFIYTGQKASGVNGANLEIFRNPGLIFVRGCQIIKPAFDKLFEFSFFDASIGDCLLTLICGVITCLAFGIIAIQVFVTYLEFLVVSTMGFILLPFGVFRPLSYLSERLVGAVIGFGIKFLVLSLIVALSEQFMTRMALPVNVGWQSVMDCMLIALALAFLSFHAPSVALSLFAGSPHLSAGTIAATAAASTFAARQMTDVQRSVGGGMLSSAVAAAGAMKGGASAAYQIHKAPDGTPIGGKMRTARAMAAGAVGAVSGPLIGGVAGLMERGLHGSNPNRVTKNEETRVALGKDRFDGGLLGNFDKGRFSVPPHRTRETMRAQKEPPPNEKSQNQEKKEANKE